ncbi:MAG TPA: tRNA cyclic N6-threonylcarbamoyladenosine(37) synthase TcdA [Acholeplasmatales bacterium]|nr:tRNA cyclic N6-threonylcarbamoyladenosine(37) synthase TcdA [Acholeplasmatales bacterium]
MSLDRFEALVGRQKLKFLRTKTVLVCGLGGVGSFAAEALGRSGLQGITLADFDVVADTNLNRQLVALASTVGKRKADVMAARIKDIDASVVVRTVTAPVSAATLSVLLDPVPDYVVDAIDDVTAKVALIARCVELRIPIVASMGFANKLHPELIRLSTIDKTTVDPLARTVRLRLRAMNIAAKVPVVYSTEPPIAPLVPGTRLGSCSFVPSVAGLYLASHVINSFLEEESRS